MAARSQPHIDPVLDNSAGDEELKTERTLRQEQFDSLIRIVRRSETSKVASVLRSTDAKLTELEIQPNIGLAIRETPEGSDQFDAGTFKLWTESLTEDDDDAVRQLLIIDATARARVL